MPLLRRAPRAGVRLCREAHIDRPVQPADLSDEEWNTYLYTRSNPKGLHAERWRHIHGCARFFNAVRDTRTDMFVTTYKVGETAPKGEGA